MTRELQIAVERAAQAAQTDPLVEAVEALQQILDVVDDHHYRGDDEDVAMAADHARAVLAKYAPDSEGGCGVKTTHTPGPWKIHEGWIVGPDFETVADPRCIPPTGENMRTMDANAALIAAAPDLLEACKAARDAGDGRNAGDWRGAIDAAVAKAEGGAK